MKASRERMLDAYRDGGLSGRKRAKLEEALGEDLEASDFLRGRDALGDLLRDSWNAAPQPPTPDHFLAAIRPSMRRIDAERAASRRPWSAWIDALGAWRQIVATAGMSAAAVGALLLASPSSVNPRQQFHHVVAGPPAGPQQVGDLADMQWPSSIYDLSQEDVPLMTYEKGGATVFFFGGEPAVEPTDDLSRTWEMQEGWV